MNTEQWWFNANDPNERYENATVRLADAQQVVTRLSDLRALAVSQMHINGLSYAQIGEKLGVSRSRAQQLVTRGVGVVG